MASEIRKRYGAKRALTGVIGAVLFAPLPVLAQAEPTAPAAAAAAPSDNAMVNLVRALVRQGVLKQDVGDQLIAQSESEAAAARAVQSRPVAAELPAASAGTIRVPYIPETVRNQIKEELRGEVLAEARKGGWAAPDQAAPDWTRNITLSGDVRVRSESALYSRTNANDIIDYATLNSFGPYGIDDPRLLLPVLNARSNQWNRARLRARLGIDATIAKGISGGVALGTGDNSGPISANTTLAGGFGKRDIWLDKAWVKVEPTSWTSVTLGRFANPFRSSDLLYDNDLRFDGGVVQLDSGEMLGRNLKLALRGGAFPYEYSAPNYPNFAFDKGKVPTKYLFSGEIEASGTFSDMPFSVAVGYHDFHGFQGQLSTPCQVETESFCSTDYLQPFYLNKGNTLSPLRQIVTVSPNADQPQLLGYTFAYRVLDANAALTIPLDDSFGVARLRGSFVKNLAFREADICRNGLAGRPYNNNGAGGGLYCAATNPAQFVGGDIGYRGELLLGTINPAERGQWQILAGYRYLESDAVLDALTDSDFHLGGTNSKGYFLGGSYVLANHLVLGARWLSANQISGPPLAIDVLQVDLEVKF